MRGGVLARDSVGGGVVKVSVGISEIVVDVTQQSDSCD